MYRGKNNESMPSLNNSISAMNRTSFAQSHAQNLQKEVDNYTRMLQQEKRRFFRVQENHRETLKDYNSKVGTLDSLKTKKFQTQMCKLNVKAVTLQTTMDKAITAYNQALSKSNALKNQINELRKDKKNSQQIYKALQQRVENLKSDIQSRKQQITQKQNHISNLKEKILIIKHQNQGETAQYKGEIQSIQRNYQNSRVNEKTRYIETLPKNEAVDNQPIVRLRLKNLLNKNKQKVKIIDQYKKTMTHIQNTFEQMMEKSGINDLEEITKTILKQEDQQTSIYHYISSLNKNIEAVNKNNEDLQDKIDAQRQINDKYRNNLTGTPEGEKRKRDQQIVRKQKQGKINQLQGFLTAIQPQLFQILKKFDLFKTTGSQTAETLSHQNVQAYLSLFEDCLQKSLPSPNICKLQSPTSRNNEKNESFPTNLLIPGQNIKGYSKAAPAVFAQDLKQKAQQKLIDSGKLRQFASDYWQKRKEASRNIRG